VPPTRTGRSSGLALNLGFPFYWPAQSPSLSVGVFWPRLCCCAKRLALSPLLARSAHLKRNQPKGLVSNINGFDRSAWVMTKASPLGRAVWTHNTALVQWSLTFEVRRDQQRDAAAAWGKVRSTPGRRRGTLLGVDLDRRVRQRARRPAVPCGACREKEWRRAPQPMWTESTAWAR
jgi:hypothetical protein